MNGNAGAGHIAPVLASLLEEQGQQLDFLLDEGMSVMQVWSLEKFLLQTCSDMRGWGWGGGGG